MKPTCCAVNLASCAKNLPFQHFWFVCSFLVLTFPSLTQHRSVQICVWLYTIRLFSLLYLQFVCPNFQVNGRVCAWECVCVYADVEREINAVLEFLINCQFDEKFVTTTSTNAEYTYNEWQTHTHTRTHMHSHTLTNKSVAQQVVAKFPWPLLLKGILISSKFTTNQRLHCLAAA